MKIAVNIIILLILILVAINIVPPKLASFYHNKGLENYNNELYDEAAVFFKKSLAIMPNNDTYDSLAHTYEKLQRLDDAVETYYKLILKDTFYIDAYIALANIYLKRQLFEKASAVLEKAKVQAPDDQRINALLKTTHHNYTTDLINKAILSYMLGKKDDAYYMLNKALKSNPDSEYANYLLAYYAFLDGNLVRAVQRVNEAIRIKPGYPQAHKLLGDIFFKRQEYDKAIDEYNKVLSSNYEDHEVYNDIGISFMFMEQYDKAIIYLKESLRFNPDNLDVMYNLASTYKDAGRFDESIAEYHKLIAYDPRYPNMYNNLAMIYKEQGKQDLAAKMYQKEIEHAQGRLSRNPDDLSDLNNIARAYNGIGDYKKARTIITKVIDASPDYRDAYITLAKIEEKEKNFDAALKALYKARSFTKYSNFIDEYISNIRKSEDFKVE